MGPVTYRSSFLVKVREDEISPLPAGKRPFVRTVDLSQLMLEFLRPSAPVLSQLIFRISPSVRTVE